MTAFRSRVNVSSTGGTNYAFYSEGSAISHLNGALEVPRLVGSASPDTDASVTLGNQATLTKGDGSEYAVTDLASIATKKYVDDKAGGAAYDDTQIKADLDSEASTRAAADTTLQANIDAKIWVGTTAQYSQISPKLPGTLYCITD